MYLCIYVSMYLCIYLSIYSSIYLSIYLSISSAYLTMYLSIYLSTWSINQSTNLSIYPSIYLSFIYLSLSVCLSVYLSASLKTKQFCETYFIFERNNIQNETILRDFFIFCTWQHPKQSNSARLLQFLNLTNIKNKTIWRDFLQKWKVECSADSLVPLRFAIFYSTSLKYCGCHEKLMPGHTKCCTCHAKSS